jgi:hypothetical protein
MAIHLVAVIQAFDRPPKYAVPEINRDGERRTIDQ